MSLSMTRRNGEEEEEEANPRAMTGLDLAHLARHEETRTARTPPLARAAEAGSGAAASEEDAPEEAKSGEALAADNARIGNGLANNNTESVATGRWTSEEHELFLQGLERFGREWRKIATLIPTRTIVQIRTHAQKYFLGRKSDREKGQQTATAEGGGGNSPRVSASRPGKATAGGMGEEGEEEGGDHARMEGNSSNATLQQRRVIASLPSSSSSSAAPGVHATRGGVRAALNASVLSSSMSIDGAYFSTGQTHAYASVSSQEDDGLPSGGHKRSISGGRDGVFTSSVAATAAAATTTTTNGGVKKRARKNSNAIPLNGEGKASSSVTSASGDDGLEGFASGNEMLGTAMGEGWVSPSSPVELDLSLAWSQGFGGVGGKAVEIEAEQRGGPTATVPPAAISPSSQEGDAESRSSSSSSSTSSSSPSETSGQQAEETALEPLPGRELSALEEWIANIQ